MGTRGPIPQRSESLARPRERNGEARNTGEITQGAMRETQVPRAGRDWHPIAKRIWDAAKDSGQADFYQNSDWAYLYSVCDDLSEYKKAGKRSSMMATVIYSALGSLLLTEGERRRARIELMAPTPDTKPAELYAIESYREDLEEDE